ncbi:MAG TPA: SusD/RagB family nutrient-binding outer membrane lipoprotein [Longimicrobiales bacterium]
MTRYIKTGVALSLALLGAACDSFIQGPGLTENPNSPTQATMTQQLVAVQANMFTRLEGQLARNSAIYTQQVIGTFNQQLQYGTQYNFPETEVSPHMSGFYTGGGLVGLRKVQADANAADDKLIEGIAKVWEGYAMGTATSIWGDLPYSEALQQDILTPKLDAQQDIYTAVQKLFDDGLTLLAAAPTTGNCDPADLIYCATPGTRALQVSRWIAATNTLKARFYLHLVERQGNTAYQAALAAATNGIAEAPTSVTQAMHGQAPGDFRSFHGNTLDDGNIWAQFLTSRQDIAAGNVLVALLKARSDPRLTAYFDANTSGTVIGVDQNARVVGTGAASVINVSVRRSLTFRQPLVTWAENQLILAEAKFKLGDLPGALANTNNVRRAVGLTDLATITFDDVMAEKYIAQFQNIDVWSDYKRTCYPTLTPFGTRTEVIGRLLYGSAERNANPNIPLASNQPARNWDDPNAYP